MSSPRKRSSSRHRSNQTGRHNHEDHGHGRHQRPHSHERPTAVINSGQATSSEVSGHSTTSALSGSGRPNQTTALLPLMEQAVRLAHETSLSPLQNALYTSLIATTPAASRRSLAPSISPSTSEVSVPQAVAGSSKPIQQSRYFPSVCHGSACQQNMGPRRGQQINNFTPSRCIRRGVSSTGHLIHQPGLNMNTDFGLPPPIASLFTLRGIGGILPFFSISVTEVTNEDETDQTSLSSIFSHEQTNPRLLNWDGFTTRIVLPAEVQGLPAPEPRQPLPAPPQTLPLSPPRPPPQAPHQEGANNNVQQSSRRRRRRQESPPPP